MTLKYQQLRVIHCDAAGCGATHTSWKDNEGSARIEAGQAGWGHRTHKHEVTGYRRKYDFCPTHEAEFQSGRVPKVDHG